MPSDTIDDIVALWSAINPVSGYTSGYLTALPQLFQQTPANLDAMRCRIYRLRPLLVEIADNKLRATADAVLTSLHTQLELARPSGAGPSGSGMGGVWAAADGVFHIVLKRDDEAPFVEAYLGAVLEAVKFETLRWWGQDFSVLVRRECLDTSVYLKGTLSALLQVRPDLQTRCDAILAALRRYEAMFQVPGLDSTHFNTCWRVFKQGDAVSGPAPAPGYPACLRNYYQVEQSVEQIEAMAQAWLDFDLPVTTGIAQQVAKLPFVKAQGSLQNVWDQVTRRYSVDFSLWMDRVVNACNDYGARYVIAHGLQDRVNVAATPDCLAKRVAGGENFAVNGLNPKTAYAQLYLTPAKNSSLLTLINTLVHEASHGFNFVLSAKNAGSSMLNLNTALEVPMAEGMAFHREYQYWAAAQRLLSEPKLNEVQHAYLALYGDTPQEQAQGVLCAQLETCIWRVIRCVRALCDVRVNSGRMTYTGFIAWAAQTTGLSEETLHAECFPCMASPGHAVCCVVGGAAYASLQKQGIARGVSEIDFNTFASRMGVHAWPVGQALMQAHVAMQPVGEEVEMTATACR